MVGEGREVCLENVAICRLRNRDDKTCFRAGGLDYLAPLVGGGLRSNPTRRYEPLLGFLQEAIRYVSLDQPSVSPNAWAGDCDLVYMVPGDKHVLESMLLS